jgi:RNA polymerase sigma-70 factor (ECF subfamily)
MELFVFDEDYVRRLREGDPATAAHFYKYFGDLLLMKLRRKLTSVEAIDEVRQEVFARSIEHLGELRDAPKLGAFVLSICRHVLLEYYRAESRTDSLGDQTDIADTRDMEAMFETARNSARVKRVMKQLPEKDAQILRAIFLDEKDKEELCRRLGIERSYLRVLLHRAKEKFRLLYLRRKSGRLSIFETFGGSSSLSI